MSLEVGLTSKTPYLDAVSTSLPSVLSDLLMSFDIFTRDKLDTLVRFCAGGACPTRIAGHANAWAIGQSRLQQRLAQLDPSTGEKRSRADDDENGAVGGSLTNGNGIANKKPKLAATAEDGVHDTEPLFTLHSLSITAPIRKKIDISITSEAIRLTNPTNGNLEARIPLSIVKRAFIVSNLGKNKNKEQWAVTLISADSYDKRGDAASQAQLAFNVDKNVPGGKDGFKTTAGADTQQELHAKGDETLPLLQAFLSHLPPHIEVCIADRGSQAFKSSSGQPYVDAYLGAKEGALCFLPQGILWANARPCEFYALEDLAPDSDTPGMGGVKTLSATGRTFSVFVRRKAIRSPDAGNEEASDYDEAEEVEETEFAMIDGRESENVNVWIRKYRSQFGRPRDVKGKGKARADPQDEVMQRNDDSDASDEDYAAPSESDGGEPSSDDESSNDDDGTRTVEEEEAEGTDEEGVNNDDEDEDEEEEELDLARHPLLRPGAMPKMSKAAMEAAITMVTQDALGTKGGHADEEEDEGDEEVDELE